MSSKLNKENLIRQFRSITNATQNDASRILKQNGYRLEASIDAFYSDEMALANASSSKSGGSSTSDRKAEEEAKSKLNKLFDNYKDEDGDDVTIEGAMAMCEDLGVSPEDVVMLPLSFYLRSPSLGTFTRASFIEGWRAIAGPRTKCDTLEAQRELLPKLRDELKSDALVRGDLGAGSKQGLFGRVYEFTYAFARPEGQKSLPLESAVAFWDLLMPSAPTFGEEADKFTQRQLNLWKTFLTEKGNGRAISKDTWMLFLDFTEEIDATFQSHDFDAAWPSQIDEFVEWARQQPPSAGAEAMDES